jgi:valyl-tRNA synthetase
MLEKTYRPQEVEARLYQAWEQAGCFKAGAGARPGAVPFCIAMPPPNVTGTLHIGHALNHSLQDILARFERMRGRDVLWQPGLDHAGIATQLVVERELAKSQTTRQELGREAFIEKVWEWKAQSGGAITQQLRRLGASCDWSRERFTMDEGLSRAVRKVFVTLHQQGLIYKDKRLVNWDPRLETAVSDLEVEMIEVKGHLWHLRYPIEGADDQTIIVATTRPETMLGDSAVAVHPDDPRYKHLIGRHVILPLVGRRIPIVGDDYADPETGSGAVKITPAHDFNDFEVGKRHNLEVIGILDTKGRINDLAPAQYRGLDRADARKKIVADLEAQGALERVDAWTHSVPHDEKTKTVVLEPMLTDQWYCDAKTLAAPAIAAVEDGRMKFVPKNWERIYFEWMRNIQPWCISRQLWWGHRIPAWYGPDGMIFVAEDEAGAQAKAVAHYGATCALVQDEDVLDTWFSSALWPFSTLGWPDQTPELARYYPTTTLVTMFDIIFFWVARMMMMGFHFMGEAPFATTLIHARVTDERGQKMSKTKGNVVDPLELIDEFGADALRFTLAMATAQGRDIRMSGPRVEGYRNFITKLWNAARFVEMNHCARVAGFLPQKASQTINRWILGELSRCEIKVTAALSDHRFNEAASALYNFIWGSYCDWYLEFAKPFLQGEDSPARAETRAMAAHVLDRILVVLHPMAPFVTEELWARTGAGASGSFVMAQAWPETDLGAQDGAADAEIDWVIRLITAIRSVRSEMNVPAGAQIPLLVKAANTQSQARLMQHRDLILRLARLGDIALSDHAPDGALQILHDEAVAILPVAEFIDVAKERARLSKEVEKARAEIAKVDAKLSNEAFIAKAPEEVVEENRERRAEFEATISRLSEMLLRLSV